MKNDGSVEDNILLKILNNFKAHLHNFNFKSKLQLTICRRLGITKIILSKHSEFMLRR